MSEDPLSDLLVDAVEVDRARLATGLKGIVGVDTRDGSIVLQPGFNKLTTLQKVVAVLLGRKVSGLLGKLEDESITPKEICDQSGMPSGTVNPKLKELKDMRMVAQTDGGRYYIPNHQIQNALDNIETED